MEVEERGEVREAAIEHDQIADGIKSVQGSVALFDRIQAGIAAIAQEHPKDAVFDLTTTAGYKRAITGRAAWRDPRIAAGKARQAAKAPVLALGRQIDQFAARVELALREGESHYDSLIAAEDARREEERQARQRAEEARVERHRQRIASIRAAAAKAIGMTAAQIGEQIDALAAFRLDEAECEEFFASTINAKAETLLQLQALQDAAVEAEERAAQAERDRLRLAELEAEAAQRRALDEAARIEREAAEAAAREAEQKTARKRQEQSAAAQALADEIRRIQRRALSASAAGMLELVTLIEAISIGDELGDFAGIAQKAKDDALADLHDLHGARVQAEIAIERQQRELAEARAESERLAALTAQQRQRIAEMDASQARPASEGSQTPDGDVAIPAAKAGQDARESAVTGDARPCTDTWAEAAQAQAVGDEGKGAHAEERAPEPATVSTGEIGRRLGFALPVAFILATLQIPNAGTDKRALLWRESQWQEIKAALVRHIQSLT